MAMVTITYENGNTVFFNECEFEVLRRDDLVRPDGDLWRFHAGVTYNTADHYLHDERVAVPCRSGRGCYRPHRL